MRRQRLWRSKRRVSALKLVSYAVAAVRWQRLFCVLLLFLSRLYLVSYATAAVTGAGTGDLRVRRGKANSRGCKGALFERPFMDSQWLSMGVSSRPPRELTLEQEAWRSTGRKRVKPGTAPATAAA